MKNDEKKKNFSYHLQQLLAGQNRTKKQVCQDLGIKPSTLSAWLKKEKFPRKDRLEDVASYFHTDIEELTGPVDTDDSTDAPCPSPVQPPYEAKLVDTIRLLLEVSPEELSSIADYAAFIHQRNQ